MKPAEPSPHRPPWAAFLAGAALALVTSGGLLAERLSLGSADRGLVVNALVTAAAVASLVFAQRGSWLAPRARAFHVAGATAGILAVHVALRLGWIPGAPWLAERPLQLVNDAALVFATLAVVWACARGIDLALFAAAVAVVLVYRLTGSLWHLDVAPHGFSISVQNLVLMQFAAAAVAVAFYRTSVAPRN